MTALLSGKCTRITSQSMNYSPTTPNQSMKPTAPLQNNFSVCRDPAVAYLCLVRLMKKLYMRRALFIAVLVLTVARVGVGQEQSARGSHRTSVEEAIRKLDNERIQAQIHADATALDRIYAADFIGVGPSGRVRTKPQVILDFTSGDLKFQSITTDDVQVRVYGNTAVETGRSIMNGQDKGQTVPRDTRFTRVWVKQQGRWRLVSNHYSSQITRQ